MTFFAVGIRRKKGDICLDVLYPTIKSDTDELKGLEQLVPIKKNTITELSIHDYYSCRDTIFPNLPGNIEVEQSGYSNVDFIFISISDLSKEIESSEEAYFRLQLLSQRKIRPHEQNLSGIFGKLENLAWTTVGPVLPNDLEDVQMQAMLRNQSIEVSHVDKFPYMVNYHVPSGVRIADASRVRLGAYLGEGTTIMPAGFVNFNAGTLGNAMIEGRISAGVLVGEDSDVGGGASIMGTLSGGNDLVISIGKKCLLGANAGTGISLGDGCTIAAGVYVYAGKKVALFNEENKAIDIDGNIVEDGKNIVKALDLSGKDFLLFMEDSQTGELICKPNTKVIQLNEALHKN